MSSYKLTYFNAMGRAEVARYLFVLSKTKYEDHRIQQDQWPALKPSTPNGQLPVLTYNGTQYCQSDAINRFLARQFKLYGKTEVEGLQIDQIIGVIGDLYQGELTKIFFLTGEEKEKAKAKLVADSLPKFLKFLEKQLGGRNWFVGNEMTLADVVVFGVLTGQVAANHPSWQTMSAPLAAFAKRFGELPAIKEYIAKRAPTPF